MPDFTVVSQAPLIRQIVQQNTLERAFHDALFPRLLYRSETSPEVWPANVGDIMLFTGTGLIPPRLAPLRPGTDPTPSTYPMEQWEAQLNQYADTIDTEMPTSINSIANLFLRNAHQLGMSAAQTLNRHVRNRLFNAAESGWTVASAAGGANATVIAVQRLNGLTRARRPDLAAGNPVRFAPVSANNPLAVNITLDDGSVVTRQVTAFAATTAGDETGPGTITVSVGVGAGRNVPLRGAVIAADRTAHVAVGGNPTNRIDDIGAADLYRMQDIRTMVARFWQMNVPEHADGRFHLHLDPTSLAQLFTDGETQRLFTAVPDHYMYRQFAAGELLGTIVVRNSEQPLPETVTGGTTATFSQDDPFAPELFNNGVAATGVRVHRPLLIGAGAVREYYQDLSLLLTEAGMTGRTGEPRITNNGIEIFADRVQLIFRAPLNRLQDQVSTSWKFIGDWPVRTDAAIGDAARYKRVVTAMHGE